jgi:pSer/pThr/pTyr-binding forkhead associated (FHA) protein
VAIAAPRPQHTEAPTQETRTLPRIGERERRRASLTMPRLAPGRYLAIEDGDEVVLLPLAADLMHIGRSPAADIVLDDASVSRRHALVTRRGERTVILDDRSRNGLHVNGARVGEAELRDGDTIVVGRVTLRFVERVT